MCECNPQGFNVPMIESFSGDNRFLSNFWPSEVRVDGVVYPTVEHAYQASKTLDRVMRAHIAMLPRAYQAKHWGHKLVLRTGWNAMRLEVMRNLLDQKFRIPELREKLLATGNQWIIEGNNWGDKFWGQVGGQGLNHLGKLLMEVRQEIRNEQ